MGRRSLALCQRKRPCSVRSQAWTPRPVSSAAASSHNQLLTMKSEVAMSSRVAQGSSACRLEKTLAKAGMTTMLMITMATTMATMTMVG